MCDVAEHMGARNAAEVAMGGLTRVAYRGYDSAGHTVDGDCTLLRPTIGRNGNGERLIHQEPVTGSVGFGHTRWTTHGQPSEAKAHPHPACTGPLVVRHDGILENYATPKERLLGEGLPATPVTLVPIQLFVNHIAVVLGLDVKGPRDLIQECDRELGVG